MTASSDPHAAQVPKAGIGELLLCLLGRRKLARVSGQSMQPLFAHDDRVLFNPRSGPPRPGDIVVARLPSPDRRLIVKRVAQLDEASPGSTGVWLLGTNSSASTDSRQFGALALQDVLGRVTARL